MKKLLLVLAVCMSFVMCETDDNTPPGPLGDIVKIHIDGAAVTGGAAPIFYIHKISEEGEDLGDISGAISPHFFSDLDVDIALTASITEGEYFAVLYAGPTDFPVARTYTFYDESDEAVCTKSHTIDPGIDIVLSGSWGSGDAYTEFKHSGNKIVMTQKVTP